MLNLIKNIMKAVKEANEKPYISNPNATDLANEFAAAIQKKFNSIPTEYFGYVLEGEHTMSVVHGPVYDQIMTQQGAMFNRHPQIHAFLNRETGELSFPENSLRPKLHKDGTPIVSFNISTKEGFDDTVALAEFTKRYLFKKA